MRIITGKARGLKLFTPKDYRVRPTADRVKEALFNIIAGKIPGAKVLDAFAGTGNLGLEAWSRGASAITFLDYSVDSLKLVKSNIEKARATKECQTMKGDTPELLVRLSRQGQLFNIIFSDPPYNKGLNEKLVQTLLKHPLLAPGGLLVLEHSLEEEPRDYLSADFNVRTEKYGDTKISLILWK
jgi:16S rRNA (guanine966-N2)-methyltransferase